MPSPCALFHISLRGQTDRQTDRSADRVATRTQFTQARAHPAIGPERPGRAHRAGQGRSRQVGEAERRVAGLYWGVDEEYVGYDDDDDDDDDVDVDVDGQVEEIMRLRRAGSWLGLGV